MVKTEDYFCIAKYFPYNRLKDSNQGAMMKKTFLIITAALLLSVPARAQTVGYIDEVKTLGYIAGQGMAWRRFQIPDFRNAGPRHPHHQGAE